jgi:hypothetical protein
MAGVSLAATLVACAAPPAPVVVAIAPPPSAAPTVAAARPLQLVEKDHADGSVECSVVDEATGAIVGRATSKSTGGGTVTCYDFVSGGQIIRFTSANGIYAKDARPGAPGDGAVPCGDGAFAEDASSCVMLDAPRRAFDRAEATTASAPFEVKVCTVSGFVCRRLITIPRGLNRVGAAEQSRWWDAKYCSDDRILVVAEGTLRLFAAPSGELLATAPAPRAVRVLTCEGGVARTTGATHGDVLSFTVERDTVRPARSS